MKPDRRLAQLCDEVTAALRAGNADMGLFLRDDGCAELSLPRSVGGCVCIQLVGKLEPPNFHAAFVRREG
jgi:hypothetical protein